MLYFGSNKLVWEIKWRVIKRDYQWCEWITYCQAWGYISLLGIECGQRFLEIIFKWWLISCKRKYYCYFRFNRLLEFMNIFILFYVIKIKLILYNKNDNLYLKIKFKKYLIFFIQNKNYVNLIVISVNYYNTL